MDDLISRQAVIDALLNYIHNVDKVIGTGRLSPKDCKDAATSVLAGLPSAQPEIIYCGECKHMMPNGKCRQFADSTIRPSASDFCSAGERKDNE